MFDYSEMSVLMERVIHKYVQMEQTKRCYCKSLDIILTRTEIHTIAAVGDHPNLNLTSLAKIQGITKGAASQMIYKLVDKGFIHKETSPNSDTEVCLSLTDLGKEAYTGHQEFHKTTDDRFFQLLRNLPEEAAQQSLQILKAFDKMLDERLQSK